MRHLRYFLFFSGMLFLLTGCRPDYEQALDNMQATQRLVSAVVHPNYDAIQEAATEGANMNRRNMDFCREREIIRPLIMRNCFYDTTQMYRSRIKKVGQR